MKLERINIKNFHCYENTTFEFGKKVTVFVGKNGSGKSSVIKAIKNALSVFFTFSNSKWEYDSIVGDVSDLKVANLTSREIWHDGDMKAAKEVNIESFTDNRDIKWSFVKSSASDSKVQQRYYKDAFIAFRRRFGNMDSWPLFAYYSDRFPHIDAKLGDNVKKMIGNDLLLYRGWGYYHWDKDDSCALIWQRRFMRIYDLRFKQMKRLEKIEDKESEEAKVCKEEIEEFGKEIDFVLSYVRKFTDNGALHISDTSDAIKITDIIVDGVDGDSYLVAYFADGSRCRWDELPAGYERLYNIVFDIAYRSYILNGCVEPFGIVMIDEMDLHLHPSMEQDVLQRLLSTFLDIQFIISTHSPLVIGNTPFGEEGKVVLLTHDGNNYNHVDIADPFGLGYEFILSAVMGTEPRNIKLQMLKDKYARLMRREKIDLAGQTLEAIKTLVVSEERYNQIVKELKDIIERN